MLDTKKPSHRIFRRRVVEQKTLARDLFNPQYTFSVEMWQRVFQYLFSNIFPILFPSLVAPILGKMVFLQTLGTSRPNPEA
jgi:hypothetical protein